MSAWAPVHPGWRPVKDDDTDQRAAKLLPAVGNTQDREARVLPQGNRSIHLLRSDGLRGTKAQDHRPEPDSGRQGESVQGIRLVTGSADPPLIPPGFEQAKKLRAM